ncbi:ATP-dependent DNA helicase [Marinobacter changyiensis]|uniref:ATP-dependent DNA helicase n=1 Tax=Marinobacter changyiensis TaxID=2604091 RepID=UPI0015D0E4A0|nr:ATP-dependent RecD-like DNA helicase [Marinobacter changyiensis]
MVGVSVKRDGARSNTRQIFVISANKTLLPIEPDVGQIWIVDGRAVTNNVEKNGFLIEEIRLQATEMKIELPNTGEQFIRFVSSQKEFAGIGEVKARKLWNWYGEDLLLIIMNKERFLLQDHLSERAMEALFAGFEKYAALEHSVFFAKNGVPQNIVQRLFRMHGPEIKDAIKNDPYRLLTFGLSWNKVDDIAQRKFGFKIDSDVRLSAAVEYCLIDGTTGGDTVMSHQHLRTALIKLLKDENLIAPALANSHDSGAFIVSEKGYHSAGMIVMEHVVAKRLLKLHQKDGGWSNKDPDFFQIATADLNVTLNAEQIEAIGSPLVHAISAITGGAGTGKTTVLRLIIRIFELRGYSVDCMALSGRAAMRLAEATNHDAMTIAKFLRSAPKSRDKPRLVIIDEASMLDIQTTYRIVTHTHPNTHLLLVGDPDQLPPIGPGNVLRDVVNSRKIEVSELNIINRQEVDTGIPEYSKSVRDGVVPEPLSKCKVFFHAVADSQINETCVKLIEKSPHNTCAIAATYKTKFGGIDQINTLAQATINNDGKRWEFELDGDRQHLEIYEGDPVIFTINDYEANVQNGTLGLLTSVTQSGDEFGTVLADDGELHSVTRAMLESLRPAYAISLHKAQGSEFNRVVVALSSSRLIDRNWLYTAVTRAKLELHIVGAEIVFKKAIERESRSSQRHTYLTELLRDP